MAFSQKYPVDKNGVSQQPASDADIYTVKHKDNFLSKLSKGSDRRYAWELIYSDSKDVGVKKFLFKSPFNGNKLQVKIKNPIEIVDLDTGATLSPTIDSAVYNYISGTNITSAKLGDYICFINKAKTVAMDTSTTSDSTEVLIFCKAIEPGKYYSVFSGSTKIAEYFSPTTGTLSQVKMADDLEGDIVSADPTWGTTRQGAVIKFDPGANKITTTESDISITAPEDGTASEEVITIQRIGGDEDRRGVRSLSLLPLEGFDGFVTQISTTTNNDANYWVRFKTHNGEASGKGDWEEYADPASIQEFDSDTIPVSLIFDLGTGAITIEPLPLVGRSIGDATTNPPPNFVGKEIVKMFEHKGRVMVLTRNTFDLSASDDGLDFFRDTVQVLQDSHPISDTFPLDNLSDEVFDGISYLNEMLVFASNGIYAIYSTDEVITPQDISINPQSGYAFDSFSKPVKGSNQVFNLSAGQKDIRLIETIKTDVGSYNSVNVSEHVRTLIDNNIIDVAASPRLGMVWIVDGEGLVCYQWFDEGQNRVQQSFTRHTTPLDTIDGIELFEDDGEIYLFGTKGNLDVVLKMTIDNDSFVSDTIEHDIHLDYRVICDQNPIATNYPSSNRECIRVDRDSRIDATYLSEDYVTVCYNETTGVIYKADVEIDANYVYLPADTNKVAFGYDYSESSRITPHRFYQLDGQGQRVNKLTQMEFNILEYWLQLVDSHGCKLKVTDKELNTSYEEVNIFPKWGVAELSPGSLPIRETGEVCFEIGQVNVDVEVDIKPISWTPLTIGASRIYGQEIRNTQFR